MKPEAQIVVKREPSEKEWTLSEFFILGKKSGVGVEDEYREVKLHGETRIDNDTYEIDFVHSPKFSSSYFMDERGNLSPTKTDRFNKPHLLMQVCDVINFAHVLWHWGNSDLDTDACYIVGSYFGIIEVKNKKGEKEKRRGVVSSRVKYVEIYPIIYQLFLARKSQGLKTYVQYRDKAPAV